MGCGGSVSARVHDSANSAFADVSPSASEIAVDKDGVRQSMLNMGLLDKDELEESTFTRATSSGTTRSLGQDSEASGFQRGHPQKKSGRPVTMRRIN
eukprot:Skav216921  [mRNA]  locus=scaffold1838:188819:196770:- [translate_table: standard]